MICFCFTSCFLVVVFVLFFLLWYFVIFLIFGNQSKTSLKEMEIPFFGSEKCIAKKKTSKFWLPGNVVPGVTSWQFHVACDSVRFFSPEAWSSLDLSYANTKHLLGEDVPEHLSCTFVLMWGTLKNLCPTLWGACSLQGHNFIIQVPKPDIPTQKLSLRTQRGNPWVSEVVHNISKTPAQAKTKT